MTTLKCGHQTTTPIVGGRTYHWCNKPKGHDGPHACMSMQGHSMYPCDHTWTDDF